MENDSCSNFSSFLSNDEVTFDFNREVIIFMEQQVSTQSNLLHLETLMSLFLGLSLSQKWWLIVDGSPVRVVLFE